MWRYVKSFAYWKQFADRFNCVAFVETSYLKTNMMQVRIIAKWRQQSPVSWFFKSLQQTERFWLYSGNLIFLQILYELETNVQWCFDVQWCPRNPNVVSTGSFDGRILIHSLMGGGIAVEGNDEEKHKNLVSPVTSIAQDRYVILNRHVLHAPLRQLKMNWKFIKCSIFLQML